jgi:hypothetical protein
MNRLRAHFGVAPTEPADVHALAFVRTAGRPVTSRDVQLGLAAVGTEYQQITL